MALTVDPMYAVNEPSQIVRSDTGASAPRPGRGPSTIGGIAPVGVRPTWRGWIHRIGVVTFLPLFGLAIALAPTVGIRVAVTVYALGITTMLGVSAVYHSGHLGPRNMVRFKRIDHTTILLGIAGSYTAISVLALPEGPATQLLIFTWAAAVIGAVIRMAWLRAPYPLVAAVYVVVGWGALLEWGPLVHGLSGLQFALLLVGGLAYTAGAAIYALHRPNPWPATFGYHEVFHSLVMIGVICHYVLGLSLILDVR